MNRIDPPATVSRLRTAPAPIARRRCSGRSLRRSSKMDFGSCASICRFARKAGSPSRHMRRATAKGSDALRMRYAKLPAGALFLAAIRMEDASPPCLPRRIPARPMHCCFCRIRCIRRASGISLALRIFPIWLRRRYLRTAHAILSARLRRCRRRCDRLWDVPSLWWWSALRMGCLPQSRRNWRRVA